MKTLITVISTIAILSSCADSSNFRGDQKAPKTANTSPADGSNGQGAEDKGADSAGNTAAADPNAAGSAGGSPAGSAGTTTDPAANPPAPVVAAPVPTACPFSALINFGYFANLPKGVLTASKTLQFPADASGFRVLITAVNVNDNTPVVTVNGGLAPMPIESQDLQAHMLFLASDISAFLRGGANAFGAAFVDRYGDEGGMDIALSGTYNTFQGCSGPSVY